MGSSTADPEPPALFQRYPELASRVAHTALGRFPTQVARLERLGDRLGSEIWVKRDDRSSALYGGNKVRKLEFVLGEALFRGAGSVWTIGGIGSHQVVACALYARQLGLESAAVVFPQPVTDHVRHVLQGMVEAGCALHPTPHMYAVPVTAVEMLVRGRLAGKQTPYFVVPGSSSPQGTLGYVSAALELAAQIERGELPRPEAVFTALGSGGTAAGLMVGFRLAGLDIPVWCVRVVAAWLATRQQLASLCRATAALLGRLGVAVPGRFSSGEMRILGGYVGDGYGHATEAGLRAMDVAANDGVLLEQTYTGKTLAALLDHVSQRRIGWKRVLFWNTFNSAEHRLVRSVEQNRAALPASLRRFLA